MATIEVASESAEGYAVRSVVDEWELTVDASGEAGPTAQQVLAADYASCFIPALRVGARKEGIDDLGRIEIDVEAELNDADDLVSIAFDIRVEASLADAGAAVIARAEDLCHVHDALREDLHADITVTDEANDPGKR